MAEPDNRIALEQVRDRTVALLGQRFAEDVIDADELDQRMERAQTAESIDALRKLTADLEDPSAPEPGLAPYAGAPPAEIMPISTSVALARPEDVREHQRSVTIFGETKTVGVWTPPRILTAFTAFGDTVLDFREARMAPGVTEVELQTLIGDIDIIVPPGLAVEVGCHAILASLSTDDEITREPTNPDPNAPRLRITGFALLADVSIQRRLPGETKREAKRRKKAERKALRKAERRRR